MYFREGVICRLGAWEVLRSGEMIQDLEAGIDIEHVMRHFIHGTWNKGSQGIRTYY